MPESPVNRESHSNWQGMNSDISPHMLPPGGMQEQFNLAVVAPGRLSGRKGMRPVTFANSADAAAGDIISIYFVHRPEADWILTHNTNGEIRCARGAS